MQIPNGRHGIPYGARVVLLFVLALSTVVVHLNQDPRLRSAEELVSDLRAGVVTEVVYDRDWPAYGTLTWANGSLSWNEAYYDPPDDVWDPVTTRLVPSEQERVQTAFLARVREAADPSVEIRLSRGPQRFGLAGLFMGSPAYARWWEPFAPVAVAAELVAWLLMLTRRNNRYAGRWAWTWMFLVGGSLLYVLLEPYPLWRGPHEALPARPRLNGTQGFALAVMIFFGLGMISAWTT
ncbi:hypothetical protein [Streptosporangium saharense]|uniref:Uncharacterized protein n=1 Tax=Streptosporangium saharense TaxID=1706840 RepID=A0A7W7VPC4_9ACTN|nr:hypothetical protein [Streptosporangium saharense]MBB4917115.1 hypothetical protein [Streptosporangium saharense]